MTNHSQTQESKRPSMGAVWLIMTNHSQTQESKRPSMGAVWRPVAVAVLLAVAGTAGAAKATPGSTPYRVSDNCAICHGMRGASTDYNIIPRLAGQHKAYLVMQLKQFRNGHRADQNGNICS
ncbi:c-type cytochrome [Acidiferrobacter sp. SPIII_3]|uniref:c-type cytochrome n=1 Tax=Acidiferrobacter sp. SPIII_3 TaxID=1281578 RepID=UPI00143E0811|nr:c-type cytochrome [Acidiferrobacter sp. SPIII_3]